MLIYDLRCQDGHRFEGWFASVEECERQALGGLIQCPHCATRVVERIVHAPRLNLAGSGAPALVQPVATESTDQPTGSARETAAALVSAIAMLNRHVRDHLEDVGPQFAAEARDIHYGDKPQRGIYGSASGGELAALADEGIEVVAIPWVLPKDRGGLH